MVLRLGWAGGRPSSWLAVRGVRETDALHRHRIGRFALRVDRGVEAASALAEVLALLSSPAMDVVWTAEATKAGSGSHYPASCRPYRSMFRRGSCLFLPGH